MVSLSIIVNCSVSPLILVYIMMRIVVNKIFVQFNKYYTKRYRSLSPVYFVTKFRRTLCFGFFVLVIHIFRWTFTTGCWWSQGRSYQSVLQQQCSLLNDLVQRDRTDRHSANLGRIQFLFFVSITCSRNCNNIYLYSLGTRLSLAWQFIDRSCPSAQNVYGRDQRQQLHSNYELLGNVPTYLLSSENYAEQPPLAATCTTKIYLLLVIGR